MNNSKINSQLESIYLNKNDEIFVSYEIICITFTLSVTSSQTVFS
jgi:hypothetical protein